MALFRADLKYSAAGVSGAVHARPTMVLEKHEGNWRIVAFQNTAIAGAAAQSGADL